MQALGYERQAVRYNSLTAGAADSTGPTVRQFSSCRLHVCVYVFLIQWGDGIKWWLGCMNDAEMVYVIAVFTFGDGREFYLVHVVESSWSPQCLFWRGFIRGA